MPRRLALRRLKLARMARDGSGHIHDAERDTRLSLGCLLYQYVSVLVHAW
jgi:hypothetical protein